MIVVCIHMIERNPKQVSIEMKDFETSWCFVKTNLLQHEKLSEIDRNFNSSSPSGPKIDRKIR